MLCTQSITTPYRQTLEIHKEGEVSTTALTEQIILVMHDMTWLKDHYQNPSLCPTKKLYIIYT